MLVIITLTHLLTKMKKTTLSYILLYLPLSLFAQGEAKDSVSIGVRATQDTILQIQQTAVVDVSELQKKIEELTLTVNQLKESENNLKGINYKNEQEIKIKDSRIKRLEDKLVFADSIIARLSNDCLRKNFDQIKVEEAIQNFDRMYSPELKSKFGRLKTLLLNYGSYSKEIAEILAASQSDKDLNNPFTGHNHAQTYIDKLKGSRYYREVYDDNWTIPYLNNLIDKCIEVIKAYNPKEKKEINLLELMK